MLNSTPKNSERTHQHRLLKKKQKRHSIIPKKPHSHLTTRHSLKAPISTLANRILTKTGVAETRDLVAAQPGLQWRNACESRRSRRRRRQRGAQVQPQSRQPSQPRKPQLQRQLRLINSSSLNRRLTQIQRKPTFHPLSVEPV